MSENKQLKFTYLLGAGASANSLAMVYQMPDSFRKVASQIDEIADKINGKNYQRSKEAIKDLEGNLIWLADKTEEFGTPDTYAKYLYLKGQNHELFRLKQTLSGYFYIEQFENKKFDNRALIFLTTILQNSIFPENIKILTWNYDFQMQLAGEFFRNERIHYGQGASRHTPPLIPYYPTYGNILDSTIPDVSMVHLNGIAGFYKEKSGFIEVYRSAYENSDGNLYNMAAQISDKKNSELNFAWEAGKSVQIAENIVTETDILVVIGYSFPFFNREVDRKIFKTLKKSLKKIYYQDPYKPGDFLRNQFDLPDNIEVKHIQSAGNYFVPIEM